MLSRLAVNSPNMVTKPFLVSTPVGNQVIVRRAYRNCLVTVYQKVTSVDLVELEMEENKELAKDVHRLARLGVCLTDMSDGGGGDGVLPYHGRLCIPNVGELRQHDFIWVIVDRVTKSTHFLDVKTTDLVEDYAKLYINEILRLHGVPVSIISDRGPQFTSHFWKLFQKGFGTQVNLSTPFPPQTNGQA
ncbi:hypothetical protein MTR67_051290 [Solanum verrucosum]|uniref:Integrase catalytic domain-containing protein n=1 Tax=Solanum verrucosum TaxID=315347 RepID=A0AAF1A2A1_SOLVR|nr:hypothetical protein MTR67_051290 [Solanum verrucosum]